MSNYCAAANILHLSIFEPVNTHAYVKNHTHNNIYFEDECLKALFLYSVLLRKTEYIAVVQERGGVNKKGHIGL